MRRVVIWMTAMVAAWTASSALAADLPRQMEVKAPVVAPVPYYNWTGFYVGINGGGAWGRSDFEFPGATTGNFDVSGALAGGTVGYNYQINQWVLGVEGDVDWSNIRGSTSCLAGLFTCQTKNDWLGTARARVGYAFDRVLPYLTGGLAVGDVKANVPGIGSASDTKAGWTIGGGVEVALAGNWSAKVEYLHVDLGKFDCGFSCGGVPPTNVKFNADVVRGGVNLRF